MILMYHSTMIPEVKATYGVTQDFKTTPRAGFRVSVRSARFTWRVMTGITGVTAWMIGLVLWKMEGT